MEATNAGRLISTEEPISEETDEDDDLFCRFRKHKKEVGTYFDGHGTKILSRLR